MLHERSTGKGGVPIRGVIFDVDGVLVDSEALIREASIRMFAELGVNVRAEDFEPFIGCGEDRYIGGVAERYGVKLDLATAKKRVYEIYLQLAPERLRPFPGAVDLVRLCRKKGLKVAVASSADRMKVEANLRCFGIPAARWDAVITAEDVTKKKPAPDIFLKAAVRLCLLPANCVVVEDSVAGVQAGKKAGMRVVAVAHTFAPEQLAGADVVRRNIAEVRLEDLLGVERDG